MSYTQLQRAGPFAGTVFSSRVLFVQQQHEAAARDAHASIDSLREKKTDLVHSNNQEASAHASSEAGTALRAGAHFVHLPALEPNV